MIEIVSVLLLNFLAEIQGGCPIRCNCTDNSVTCISKDLEYVPYFESLTNNPVIIDLSGTSISSIDIDDFSFDKSDQVMEIYINGSELISIEETAFDELENLQELYLSDNVLNSVSENIILNNHNMILLDLSSNYFTDMPKIKSDSLEVLVIANSGLLKIADAALNDLPNLRILLIQQNNLKTVNPAVFEKMSNLFFVRMSYNPWFCNCKTVQLFDYLTIKGFVDGTETVQCQNEDKLFVDIYNKEGPVTEFKQQCDNVNNALSKNSLEKDETWELEQILNESDESEESDSIIPCVQRKNYDPTTDETDADYLYFASFYYSVLLCSAIILSLIIGAISGSYLTYKYLHQNLGQTQSVKELLSKSNDYFA